MSLFAELGPAELEQIASWLNVEERESGTTLAQQGASGYAFYVLRHGTATVHVNPGHRMMLTPSASPRR
jgi:signal-transduction protein with cAMP-binding, CBS, and nucleotidyltransferase domain